ncbi:hypothetical protein BDM02DRAFT_3119805 [Thelephora ganbajun]|uniref:Uncharacterized protein n=1 Tax=Thelephora ganbajun TaxID=370292 RepID=A0ACB6Z834_THEGA|nr:hypothetical protein BDM02DRAFT_3119805 [Thelephora ganbajun]
MCPAFFMDAYRAVYEDARDYIAAYGCIHAGGNEMNEGNVLFEYDANNHVRLRYYSCANQFADV